MAFATRRIGSTAASQRAGISHTGRYSAEGHRGRAVRDYGRSHPGDRLTVCQRSEVIGLRCGEVHIEGSCLRLTDSKEGASVRPLGLPVLEYLESRRDEEQGADDYVFPGWEDDTPFGSFPRQWTKILAKTELAGITPHVLRHSFASIGNDLGFTEATIAALVGHSRGTVTSRYIHTLDTALIMAAHSIAGYIQGLLDGVAFTRTVYALDRDSRKSALAHFLGQSNPAMSNGTRLSTAVTDGSSALQG